MAALLLLANGIMNRANGRLVSSGERRSYIVYVPPSYQPGTPVPLVITIHGYAGWAAHQATLSGWNELADEYGFIVVYPSGTDYPKHWRTNGKPGSENDPQIEVQFMNDLLDQLEAQYSIDPTRIYANGISNGGGMSHLISCTLASILMRLSRACRTRSSWFFKISRQRSNSFCVFCQWNPYQSLNNACRSAFTLSYSSALFACLSRLFNRGSSSLRIS